MEDGSKETNDAEKLRITLSSGLNKPISDNFVKTLTNFYSKNHSLSKFVNYTKVLGFPNEDFSKEIYSLLEQLPSEQLSSEPCNDHKKPKLEQNPPKPTKSAPQLSLSFDDDLDLPPSEPKPKPSFKFKKIKKEDALRIKGVESEKEVQTPPKGDRKEDRQRDKSITDNAGDQRQNHISKQPVTQKENINTPSNEFHESLNASLKNELDIDNDREWYMTDEFGQNTGEINTELEQETYSLPSRKPFKPRPKRKLNVNETGGGFDSTTGEYYDLDHQNSYLNDVSKVSIMAHFFIPPFLEDSKDYLTVNLTQNNSGVFTKGIASDFNPIKNPNSELGIAAKQGSLVVKERRSKKERAQQAKDRSNLTGTQLGNVLGVDDSTEADNSKHQPEIKDERPSVAIIDNQRKSLPVYTVRSQLLQFISDNQITIIIGETGSGKTTQLTQYLYEEGYGSNIISNKPRRIIGCTQPRRVAAMSVAKRVSDEMNCPLGDDVGYAIRFEDKTTFDKTVIKYMTDGVLLKELLVDPNLDNYSCIIMDEAHERSLSTDILLGLLRLLVQRRKDIKIIITSATMNADRFTTFFGNSPQFTIPGRTFPVEVFHTSPGSNDYVETAVKQVITVHLSNINENKESDGDILVFMTGQEDIEVTCEMIQEKLDELEDVPPLDIFPVYSTLPSDLQKKIFNKTNNKRRKVVVATNIAETSLTVDGVKYVIDSGLVKVKVYNPKLGMDALQAIPISVANAQQRSGRAGRTGPGVAYRLYSEKECNEQMNLTPVPEIQRTNLNNVMLILKSLRVSDVNKFPFLDPPPKDILSYSLYDLWSIGALNNLGELTQTGLIMNQFPMEPSLAKLIILSVKPQFHCSQDIITIVSMLSVPNIFHRPKERAAEADSVREKFAIAESDHLTLLNVYNQWETQLKKPKMTLAKLAFWCGKNFVNNRSLLRARDIKNQVLLIMKKLKFPVLSSKNDDDIRRCICASFYNQAAKLLKMNLSLSGQAEYIHLRHNFMRMYLHPTSALNGGTDLAPAFVVYHELILTTKEYMSCVTSVDPMWLLEYGYVFYDMASGQKSKYLEEIDFNYIDKDSFQASLDKDRVKYKQLMDVKIGKQHNGEDNGNRIKKVNRFKGI